MPRPPEQFQRVYSAPEPPARSRASRTVLLVAAIATVAGAAVAAFLLLPGGDTRGAADRGAAGGRNAASAGPTSAGPSAAGKPPARAQVLSRLPPACGTVSPGTVRRLVPGARSATSSNTTFGSCTYTSERSGFRWLRVETRLYVPSADGASPVDDARHFFGAQWGRAGRDTLARTVVLRREPGLGDEAYRWFKIDKGQPTVVGEVGVRFSNAVITVSYSEDTSGKNDPESCRQRCVSEATVVAREVLEDFR